MTKKLLKNAFTRSDFKIEKLFLKRLKKLYDKQGRLQKFTRHYNNFILDVDTTGMKFKRNALVFPRLFEEFDYISSIQIYTPYEIWLNQILERKIIRSFKYSTKVRRILHDSFPLNRKKGGEPKDFITSIMKYGNHTWKATILKINFALTQLKAS